MADAAVIADGQPIEISSVPPESVEHVWYSQIEMVEKIMRHGQGDFMVPAETLEKVKSGERTMWVVHRGADILGFLIFSIVSNARMTKVYVHMLAGRELPSWSVQVYDLFKEFIELIGADCVEASCRPGLAKHLKKVGWTQKAVIMELK